MNWCHKPCFVQVNEGSEHLHNIRVHKLPQGSHFEARTLHRHGSLDLRDLDCNFAAALQFTVPHTHAAVLGAAHHIHIAAYVGNAVCHAILGLQGLSLAEATL